MPNERSRAPILNPVLTLLSEPRPASTTAGGKKREDILVDSYEKNYKSLMRTLSTFREDNATIAFADIVVFKAKLQRKFNSPSSTPDDLFSISQGVEYLASMHDGHLFETPMSSIPRVIEAVRKPNIRQQVDISRLDTIEPFSSTKLFCSEELEAIWSKALPLENDVREFSFWLIPFISMAARSAVVNKFQQSYEQIIEDNIQRSPTDYTGSGWMPSSARSSYQQIIDVKLNQYLEGSSPKFSIRINTIEKLRVLIASEVVARLEPSSHFQTSMPPGSGSDPVRLSAQDLQDKPIVGVIDGGMSAQSYRDAVAEFPDEKLVGDFLANKNHGNKVASLVIDACGWNNNLDLPDIPCRVVPFQILPKSLTDCPSDEDILEFIDRMMERYAHINVWNLSSNQCCECDEHHLSYIGLELTKIARKHNKLLVISAGNVDQTAPANTKISPPADCESALVVGGRNFDSHGQVSSQATVSRNGLGPAHLHKPEISWFSTVKALGGQTVTGTSYSAPLVSRVAAHTWEHLTHPTPDLVKTIILNRTDLFEYCHVRGWGSPVSENPPWYCSKNSATLLWSCTLNSGARYYWNDIYVPPPMLDDQNNMKGEIILTAVLEPYLNERPIGNPFLTRLEVSLQRINGSGGNLLGSCLTSDSCGPDFSKWNPVRMHRKRFDRTNIPSGKLRLYARIFFRERSRLSNDGADLSEVDCNVAFALTFKSIGADDDTYNEFVRSMRNSVQSAVTSIDIDIDTL